VGMVLKYITYVVQRMEFVRHPWNCRRDDGPVLPACQQISK